MGHNVGDAAARSVKKSEKKAEKAARTDEQIFVDVEKLLDAHLSVPPVDIRLLLTRYREFQALLNRAIDPVVEQAAKELMTSEGGSDGSQEEAAPRT